MEIITSYEQGDPQWFIDRSLRMTGSHGYPIGVNGTGLVTYITKKMREHYQVTPVERYESKGMIRGTLLEPEAGELYELETFSRIKKIAFVIHSAYVGVSPDLFVDEDGLAEIKCPESKEYFRLLLIYKKTGILEIELKYMWQIQMQLLCCKKKWCDYVVYSPDFKQKIMITRVLPDFKMYAALGRGFVAGEEMIKNTMKIMEAA
jgi:hypothetical protein